MTRVGDPERERSALALRRHYVEGRLDETELSERLELVFRARSRRELRVALRQLPRWSEFAQLAERLRHAALVAVVTVVWLMLSATLLVAFIAWVAAHGATIGGLVVFPTVWILLSVLLYHRTAISRRRFHRL
jgi:Domain of unknown function (DUF1707)